MNEVRPATITLRARREGDANVPTFENKACRRCLIWGDSSFVEHRLCGKQIADDVLRLGSRDINRDGHLSVYIGPFDGRSAVFLPLRSPLSFGVRLTLCQEEQM